jgi:hypothetical protein
MAICSSSSPTLGRHIVPDGYGCKGAFLMNTNATTAEEERS